MLGQSHSLNAMDMLRWRDIAGAMNFEESDDSYDPSSAAFSMSSAVPKRKSDGGDQPLPGSRRASIAAAAQILNSPAGSRAGSLMQPIAPGLIPGMMGPAAGSLGAVYESSPGEFELGPNIS